MKSQKKVQIPAAIDYAIKLNVLVFALLCLVITYVAMPWIAAQRHPLFWMSVMSQGALAIIYFSNVRFVCWLREQRYQDLYRDVGKGGA